eukprot:15330497-Ditylum_brightwellii.AAC.1
MDKSTKSKAKSKGSGGDAGGGSNNKRSGEGNIVKKRSSSKTPVPSKKKKRSPKQSTLIPSMGKVTGKDGQGYFSVHKKEQLMTEKDILALVDTVYNNLTRPAYLKGKLFHYNVRLYNSQTKYFILIYLDKYIDQNGVDFQADTLGFKKTLESIKIKMVKDGMELYYHAVGRMNDHTKKKKAVAEAKMKQN